MPSIRRVYYTRPIPNDAERVTHRGKPAVRFKGEDGKPVVATLTQDGTLCRVPSAKWYGQYTDADGVTRRVPLSINRTVAQQMLAGLVRKAELAKAGVRDPFEDHRIRPLADHLADWERVLTARRNTPAYVALKLHRARRLFDACGFRAIADLSASKLEAALGDLGRRGASTQTLNHYLAAAKQFARWLVRDRRAADDPLAHLAGGNVRLDRRLERRALADDELAALFGHTRGRRPTAGLSGRDREVLYATAVFTGLRAAELASHTPEAFDLAPDAPRVRVSAGHSKRRREDVLPLHPALAALLGGWLAGKPPRTPVWPGPWAAQRRGGKMLIADAAHARRGWVAEAATAAERATRQASAFLARRDGDGRVIDFHALRHTFISRLARHGVQPKVAQELARHSTITLTLDRYTHTDGGAAAAAVRSLPAIGGMAESPALPLPSACPPLALTADLDRHPVSGGETIGPGEPGAGMWSNR